MRYFSPAKLNLFFRVLGRRSDGFHEIASLFQTIDLGDNLEIEQAGEDRLTSSDPQLPCDEKNLVVKALHLFRLRTGLGSFRVQAHLEKNIPMEAGLGGGSSNAATMLFACNEIAGYPASMQELARWASELGSDAAFFFSSGSAYCTGRGENFVDQNFQAERVLVPGQAWIAKPSFGVSTQKAYAASRPEHLEQRDPLAALESFLKGTPQFFNDLEVSSFFLCPQLLDVKTALLEAGFSTVVMTGSGSAFICLGLAKAPQVQGLSFTPIRPLQREKQEWYSSLSTICV